MLREQFLKADRRVRCYYCLILLLTACAAIGLGLVLPAWAEAREWLLAHRGEGTVRLLVGLLVEVVVLGPLLLVPFLSLNMGRPAVRSAMPRVQALRHAPWSVQ